MVALGPNDTRRLQVGATASGSVLWLRLRALATCRWPPPFRDPARSQTVRPLTLSTFRAGSSLCLRRPATILPSQELSHLWGRRSEAGLSGFLGGLGSQEILELVIFGSIREVCASSFSIELLYAAGLQALWLSRLQSEGILWERLYLA